MPSAYYTSGDMIIRLADRAIIPRDEGNADYQRYLSDVADNAADPVYVVAGRDPTRDLDTAKADAIAELDAIAETVRARFDGVGVGQSRVYAAKMQQAQEFKSQGGNVAQWAFIMAEAEALGITPAAAATRIINAEQAWVRINARIERVRMGGKKALAEAADFAALQAALQQACAAVREITDKE